MDLFWTSLGVSVLILTIVYCIEVLRNNEKGAKKILEFVTTFRSLISKNNQKKR